MRFYEATSRIAGDPEAVWSVLADGDAWPTWNSGVTAVEGQIEPGSKIVIRSEVAPGRAFPVKVTGYDRPRRITFTGGMPLGLFKGVRTYELAPDGNEATTFHLREEYTGPLAGLIWRTIPDLGPSFTTFADGLKRRVEAGA